MGDHHIKKRHPGLWAILLVVAAIGILVYVTTRVSTPDGPVLTPQPAPVSTSAPVPPSPTAAPVDSAGCSTDSYGDAQDRVQQVGHYLAKRYKITHIEGVSTDDADHAVGLALNFYFDNKDDGDNFARYLVAHRDVLDINYIMWQQRASIAGEWSTMADRGSNRANHFDNVEVSFRADPEHALTCE